MAFERGSIKFVQPVYWENFFPVLTGGLQLKRNVLSHFLIWVTMYFVLFFTDSAPLIVTAFLFPSVSFVFLRFVTVTIKKMKDMDVEQFFNVEIGYTGGIIHIALSALCSFCFLEYKHHIKDTSFWFYHVFCWTGAMFSFLRTFRSTFASTHVNHWSSPSQRASYLCTTILISLYKTDFLSFIGVSATFNEQKWWFWTNQFISYTPVLMLIGFLGGFHYFVFFLLETANMFLLGGSTFLDNFRAPIIFITTSFVIASCSLLDSVSVKVGAVVVLAVYLSGLSANFHKQTKTHHLQMLVRAIISGFCAFAAEYWQISSDKRRTCIIIAVCIHCLIHCILPRILKYFQFITDELYNMPPAKEDVRLHRLIAVTKVLNEIVLFLLLPTAISYVEPDRSGRIYSLWAAVRLFASVRTPIQHSHHYGYGTMLYTLLWHFDARTWGIPPVTELLVTWPTFTLYLSRVWVSFINAMRLTALSVTLIPLLPDIPMSAFRKATWVGYIGLSFVCTFLQIPPMHFYTSNWPTLRPRRGHDAQFTKEDLAESLNSLSVLEVMKEFTRDPISTAGYALDYDTSFIVIFSGSQPVIIDVKESGFGFCSYQYRVLDSHATSCQNAEQTTILSGTGFDDYNQDDISTLIVCFKEIFTDYNMVRKATLSYRALIRNQFDKYVCLPHAFSRQINAGVQFLAAIKNGMIQKSESISYESLLRLFQIRFGEQFNTFDTLPIVSEMNAIYDELREVLSGFNDTIDGYDSFSSATNLEVPFKDTADYFKLKEDAKWVIRHAIINFTEGLIDFIKLDSVENFRYFPTADKYFFDNLESARDVQKNYKNSGKTRDINVPVASIGISNNEILSFSESRSECVITRFNAETLRSFWIAQVSEHVVFAFTESERYLNQMSFIWLRNFSTQTVDSVHGHASVVSSVNVCGCY
ncbi:hypothetical protein PCE1_000636 [Barthelona sp. PCE]